MCSHFCPSIAVDVRKARVRYFVRVSCVKVQLLKWWKLRSPTSLSHPPGLDSRIVVFAPALSSWILKISRKEAGAQEKQKISIGRIYPAAPILWKKMDVKRWKTTLNVELSLPKWKLPCCCKASLTSIHKNFYWRGGGRGWAVLDSYAFRNRHKRGSRGASAGGLG